MGTNTVPGKRRFQIQNIIARLQIGAVCPPPKKQHTKSQLPKGKIKTWQSTETTLQEEKEEENDKIPKRQNTNHENEHGNNNENDSGKEKRRRYSDRLPTIT